MSEHIRLISCGWNMGALRAALRENPQLWDQRTERTAPEDSPHHGLSDIWVRFADPETMREDGSHDSPVPLPKTRKAKIALPMVRG